MCVITLITDFALHDAFVGAMKGVILNIAPHARIVDLTHEVPPQNILSGAFLLKTAYPYFPAGTIHVAVVDPGVGAERRAIAVQAGGYTFIAPDNGLLTYVLRRESAATCYELNRPEYHLPDVSRTFHGRDVFAPVAGHVANGVSLDQLGERIESVAMLDLPSPAKTQQGWTAHIIHIDHFGNLITDFDLPGVSITHVTLREHTIPFALTYDDVAFGKPAAICGSSGHLEIAINRGHAATHYRASVGDVVRIECAS